MTVNGEGPCSRLMPEAGAGLLLCSVNTPAGGTAPCAVGVPEVPPGSDRHVLVGFLEGIGLFA